MGYTKTADDEVAKIVEHACQTLPRMILKTLTRGTRFLSMHVLKHVEKKNSENIYAVDSKMYDFLCSNLLQATATSKSMKRQVFRVKKSTTVFSQNLTQRRQ